MSAMTFKKSSYKKKTKKKHISFDEFTATFNGEQAISGYPLDYNTSKQSVPQ